jgi:methionine biosynthesis protein MetW
VIVTFPNFGYWRHRIQLIQGQMPVSKSLPYEWYNTPNIHLCTIKDFDDFCAKNKIGIKERLILAHGKPIHVMPNLMGALAMYRLVSK